MHVVPLALGRERRMNIQEILTPEFQDKVIQDFVKDGLDCEDKKIAEAFAVLWEWGRPR